MENEMHPYDRISHSKLFSEGLAELTLALLESPNPCDKSLYVLHEMSGAWPTSWLWQTPTSGEPCRSSGPLPSTR